MKVGNIYILLPMAGFACGEQGCIERKYDSCVSPCLICRLGY